MCCTTGLEKSNNFFGFDLYLKETRLHDYYEENPVKARLIFVTVGAVSGLFKTFLFPLMTAFGCLYMAFMAVKKLVKGEKKEALSYLQGFAFSVLGLGASVAFIMVTGYYIPLIWSSALFVGFIVVSMTFHVYKMAKKPPEKSAYLEELS